MIEIKPEKKTIIIAIFIEITIALLLFLQKTAPAFHWIYIIVYIPILLLVVIVFLYNIETLPLLLLAGVFIGRILPFIVIFYNLKIVYGFIGIVLFELIEFVHTIYYPYMFRTFPRRIGKKLNQSWRLIGKFVKKKQYLDIYKQIDNVCLYIINLIDNKTENNLSDMDLSNLNEMFNIFCYLLIPLSATFSRIGNKDYANLLLETYKNLLIKRHDVINKNIGREIDKDETFFRLQLLWSTVEGQIVVGNKAEALKLFSDYERELEVFQIQHPDKISYLPDIKQPYIHYTKLYLTDSSVSQEKVKLLKDWLESFQTTTELMKVLQGIVISNLYYFESARLAIHEGLLMMRDAKFSEAKSSFEKANFLFIDSKKLWSNNIEIEYSGKISSSISESLYKFVESRIESNEKVFIEAKNLLISRSKYAEDTEIIKLFNQIIDCFEKSGGVSVYSNEFKTISDYINRDVTAILTILVDRLMQGGGLSDKLPASMRQKQTSSELNKDLIVQGLAIILMAIGIYAQQNSIILLVSFLVGILLFGLGGYLTFKKGSV